MLVLDICCIEGAFMGIHGLIPGWQGLPQVCAYKDDVASNSEAGLANLAAALLEPLEALLMPKLYWFVRHKQALGPGQDGPCHKLAFARWKRSLQSRQQAEPQSVGSSFRAR